jgi:hypothetical protein
MVSIFWLTIIIFIISSLIGSVVIALLISGDTNVSQEIVEKKCEKIVLEGFAIHQKYPDSYLEDISEEDRKKLISLDQIWFNDCVSLLPQESIFRLVQKVEDDFFSGE